ncbi:tetratricopeptide repeat protein [Rosistilla ulvae]|uniref:Tetratricopeptide repeat protein n=1 Tax=Rosistilla ulvae TaxID=1930277 RepID=A0A517LV13_9BACT|nr:tetratricopeptide repeat protein [Rosistilla ulvae]
MHSFWKTELKCQLLATALLALSLSGCQFAASGQNAQGVRLYDQGQYSAALQQFQQAISSDPKNPDSYYNLAATTHRLAKERNDRALMDQAESLYNQCLDIQPSHVDCHRGLAVLLVETDRPDRAFALLRNWATSQPQLADSRIELARLYQEFGEGETAQKFLEDAIHQDGNNARAWLALGQIREAAGDYQQALQDYQRSYDLNSMQPQVAERIASMNRQIVSGVGGVTASGTRLAQQSAADVSKGRY